MIKQKAILVCDFCKKEMDKSYILTEDVPHEGMSMITCNGTHKSFYVGGQHYCCLDCLYKDIEKELGIEN